MKSPDFIIIYDTYCGWCYGAAPVFDALVNSGAEVEVLHRHLFQGSMAPRMADGKGQHILQADAQIAALTGQTFTQHYTDSVVLSDTEILESKYSAQAAALVHEQGAQKEFAVRSRLEKARFIDGVSASDRDAVITALIAEGVADNDANRIGSEELVAKADEITHRAQQLMASVDAQGVPTILRVVNSTPEAIEHTQFYGNPNGIIELVPNELLKAS